MFVSLFLCAYVRISKMFNNNRISGFGVNFCAIKAVNLEISFSFDPGIVLVLVVDTNKYNEWQR